MKLLRKGSNQQQKEADHFMNDTASFEIMILKKL
jgi:hypothetical protein